jgi:hypothetical protein
MSRRLSSVGTEIALHYICIQIPVISFIRVKFLAIRLIDKKKGKINIIY